MAKPTVNPVEHTYTNQEPPHISEQTFHIAGILTTVFGLEELSNQSTKVACLWLLHPRLQTQACMRPFAASTIHDWNTRLREGRTRSKKGLIAVSFDQRNHGSREVDSLANEAWRSGNQRHAQDMFSCYHGTALDTSLLLDYISAYAFPDNRATITQHLVLGISLGGHAAWHLILHDPRITTAVICIGCPDYTSLLSDRARLSKRPSYTHSQPPGASFVGSTDFPPALVEAVQQNDPAGFFWSPLASAKKGQEHLHKPSTEEKAKLTQLMARTLAGKRILNLSGGADKLVPYRCGEPFIQWLKRTVGKGGWYEHGNVLFEDQIFDGVGHEVPWAMVPEMVRFVSESTDAEPEGTATATTGKRSSRDSRI